MNKIVITEISIQEFSKLLRNSLVTALEEIKRKEAAGERFLKPRDAGDLIGHSESFVRKLVKKGQLKGYYPGSSLVVSYTELMEWMATRKINP